MSEIDDGVIKYDRGHFTPIDSLEADEYSPLEKWRKKLYQLELIGEYRPENIGYGNVSWLRPPFRPIQFVITGTQTGKYSDLTGEHYTRVKGYDLEKNIIVAEGPLEASSEALTHAAMYEACAEIRAVFHIHDSTIWEGMLKENLNVTAKEIPYGTVAMAQAVRTLVAARSHGALAMAGHADGVIAWGADLDQAGAEILALVERFKS